MTLPLNLHVVLITQNSLFALFCEEFENYRICFVCREHLRNLKISISTETNPHSTIGQTSGIPNMMDDLPREISTIFCQSTSKKALDVFDRSMTRMYK